MDDANHPEKRYGSTDFGQGGLNTQLDVDSLLREIGLDQAEIDWRKEFIGFEQDDARRLETYEDIFRANADQVADDFYDNITDHEQTTEIIGNSEKGLEALKRTQSAYLVTLTAGEYGQDYFRDRARIGKIHDMLDMPMKHYLGQYSVYYNLILPLVGERLVTTLTDRLTETATGSDTSPGEIEEADDTASARTDAPDGGIPGESIEAVVEAEVDETIQDLLAILRIINLSRSHRQPHNLV